MDDLINLASGTLSPAARVWTALAPALLLSSYFAIGLLIYSVRILVVGKYHDEEMESRGSSVALGMWIRLFFAWIIRPVWRLILATGIPATALTTLSVLLAISSGVAFSAGRFALGGWLFIFAGICDLFDGRLARLRNEANPWGAALDSILDRYSDAAVLIGLGWFYRDSWVLLVVLFAFAGTFLVPYIRAKGEALGVEVKVGLAQRPERIVYLGVAGALSPILEVIIAPNEPHPIHRLAVVGLVLLAVTTQATALRRFTYLLGALRQGKPKEWKGIKQGAVARTVVAAGIATGLDFAAVVALVSLAHFLPWLATAVGCGLGALVNFAINRLWTFGSNDRPFPQAARYGFVSTTSALLNAGGVAVLLLLPTLDYRIAWVCVRLAVFLAWNFPLQRDYVFSWKPQ